MDFVSADDDNDDDDGGFCRLRSVEEVDVFELELDGMDSAGDTAGDEAATAVDEEEEEEGEGDEDEDIGGSDEFPAVLRLRLRLAAAWLG